MAVFDVESNSWDNIPRRVFDATGAEIHKCIRINTDTGEVTQFETDKQGKVLVDEAHDALRQTKFFPAPLRVFQSVVLAGKKKRRGKKWKGVSRYALP